MADTVTVPGTKAKVPKWAAIAGVAGVGVLIIVYYRNKKSQASAAVTPGTTAGGLATPATGGSDPFPWDDTYNNPSDPYSMDTSTGITYGDESAGIGGSGFPFNGGGGGGGGSGSGGGLPFSTNAAWAQWVIAQLETNPNRNPTDIENAIGEYISGQPVTAPGKNIVFDAIAIGGDPPVAGPNGYPPKVRSSSTAGPPPPPPVPPGPKPQVIVPAVEGNRVNDGEKKLEQAGLVPKVTSGGPRNPALEYVIGSQTPGAGKKVNKGSTVDLSIRRVTSGAPVLQPGGPILLR